MKKIISIMLVGVLLLTGCSASDTSTVVTSNPTIMQELEDNAFGENSTQSTTELISERDETLDISIKGLNDENLLRYVEDNLYTGVVGALDSDGYFVENVEAIYYPKEYI